MKLAGKVAVVTGAGSGIGRELTLQLLQQNASVAGVDLNEGALQETSRLAGEAAARFEGYVANVGDRNAVDSLPNKVRSRFGEVDCVINNAGIIQPFRKVIDLDYPAIERVLNVNLFGTLYVVKAFLPLLLKRPEAHLVNLSSMGGFVPVPGQTLYGASKAAVKLLSEGLRSELMNTSVRVSVVCPGAVATNISGNSGLSAPRSQPERRRSGPRPLSSAAAARLILRGVERNKPYIFVGRDATLMDKIYRLNPSFAARLIAKKMAALLQSA